MKIRITKSSSGFKFPYGPMTEANRQFLIDFLGEEFTAERINMNYYKLKNGMLVHIYNAHEIKEVSCK